MFAVFDLRVEGHAYNLLVVALRIGTRDKFGLPKGQGVYHGVMTDLQSVIQLPCVAVPQLRSVAVVVVEEQAVEVEVAV